MLAAKTMDWVHMTRRSEKGQWGRGPKIRSRASGATRSYAHIYHLCFEVVVGVEDQIECSIAEF